MIIQFFIISVKQSSVLHFFIIFKIAYYGLRNTYRFRGIFQNIQKAKIVINHNRAQNNEVRLIDRSVPCIFFKTSSTIHEKNIYKGNIDGLPTKNHILDNRNRYTNKTDRAGKARLRAIKNYYICFLGLDFHNVNDTLNLASTAHETFF